MAGPNNAMPAARPHHLPARQSAEPRIQIGSSTPKASQSCSSGGLAPAKKKCPPAPSADLVDTGTGGGLDGVVLEEGMVA